MILIGGVIYFMLGFLVATATLKIMPWDGDDNPAPVFIGLTIFWPLVFIALVVTGFVNLINKWVRLIGGVA